MVGIPTYRREGALADLLRCAVFRSEAIVRIIVGDNDPQCSARTVLQDIADPRVMYVHASEPGVVAIRNAILDAAAAIDGVSGLAFIDDDQVPTKGWLDALLRAHAKNPHNILTGPVTYVLPPETPNWLRKFQYFEQSVHPEGAALHVTAAGNSFLPARLLISADARFDATFARIGGEDTDLFGRLTGAGETIAWVPGMSAIEPLAPERANFRWLLRRYVRNGNVLGTIRLRKTSRATVLVGGLARFGLGACKCLVDLANLRFPTGAHVGQCVGGVGFFLAGARVQVLGYGSDSR